MSKWIYCVYLDAFSLARIAPATPVYWCASGRVWLCISSLRVKKWKLKINRVSIRHMYYQNQMETVRWEWGTPFKLSVETLGASQGADDSPALRALGVVVVEGKTSGAFWKRGIFTMTSKVRFTNRLVTRDVGMALEGMEWRRWSILSKIHGKIMNQYL